LIFITLVISYFSWKYYELPMRKSLRLRRFSLIFIVLSGLTLVSIGYIGHKTDGFRARFNFPENAINQFEVKKNDKCLEVFSRLEGEDTGCVFGVSNAPHSGVLVAGDSHAGALAEMLHALAVEKNSQITLMSNGGCPPFIGIRQIYGNYASETCDRLARAEVEYVRSKSIRKVILVGRWSLYTEGDYGQKMDGYFLTDVLNPMVNQRSSQNAFVNGLRNTVQIYKELGVEVAILLQVPQQFVEPHKLYFKLAVDNSINYSESLAILIANSIKLNDHLKLQQFSRDAIIGLADDLKFEVINPDEFFCDRSVCMVGDLDNSLYRDKSHLNITGAQRLGPVFLREIFD
jgi:hypothetical protein